MCVWRFANHSAHAALRFFDYDERYIKEVLENVDALKERERWVWYRGGFAFVTFNIAVEKNQHATHRPSVYQNRRRQKCSIKHYKSKGVGYIPKEWW